MPLIEIEEALAELEAVDVPAAAAEQLSVLAKQLGDHYSGVRVSGAGLETEDEAANRLRWLDLMDAAADGCIVTLDRMARLLAE